MGCIGSNEEPDIKVTDVSNNWPRGRVSPAKSNFKVVFLGKSGVGKTSITLRFCRDTFQVGTEATIGASFLTKIMQTDNNRQIKFEMWDTAGQERYRALAPMYYRNADAAVLVYDITDPESFAALRSWYQELQRNVPNCIVILAGNKLDLERGGGVQKEGPEQFSKEHECPLFEVSSKTGEHINDLFSHLLKLLTDKYPG